MVAAKGSIWFTYLTPFRFRCNICYRPLFSIQLCSASIFLHAAVLLSCCPHILLLIFFFQVFFGRPLPLWPCDIHWSAYSAMLSSHLLRVCHFLRRIRFSTGFCSVFLHNSLSLMMSGQCVFIILRKNLLMNTFIQLAGTESSQQDSTLRLWKVDNKNERQKLDYNKNVLCLLN